MVESNFLEGKLMKTIQRFLALGMCLLMLVSLCACGDAASGEKSVQSLKEAENAADSVEKVSFSTENAPAGETEYSYSYVEYTLPESVRISAVVPGGGSTIYVIGTACDSDGYFLTDDAGVLDTSVIGYDISSGASFQFTPDYAGHDDYAILAAATGPDGSLWVLAVFYDFADGAMTQTPQYIHLDASGQVLDRLSAPMEALESDGYMQVDGQGNLYFLSDTTGLILCDESGNLLMESEMESAPMCRTADGAVCVLVDTETGTGLAEVDPETHQLGEAVEIQGISNGVPTLCGGESPAGAVLAYDATSIYEIDLETGTAAALVDLEQYGVSGAGAVSRLDDGTFIFLLSETKAFSVSALAAAETASAKTVLSLATAYPDTPLMDLVNDFNRSSADYYIQVFDCSAYLDSGSDSDLLRAWNEAFVFGDIPDMIDFFNLPWHSYAEKGFLLDLNDCLDTSDILPWLWDAVKYDGANYTFPSGFEVETLYGKSAALNDRTSWTLEEFLSVQDGLPEDMELFDNLTQDLFLYYVEQYMLEDFIDYEAATCQFDSAAFVSLLDFAKSLPAEAETADEDVPTALKIRRDQVLLAPVTLTSIAQMQDLEAYTIGEDIAWIGWPGATASKIQPISAVAVTAASAHVEGAVEFLEYLLSAQSQQALSSTCFPITQDAFSATIQQAEAAPTGANPEIATEKTVDGTTYPITPLSQEKAAAYTAWLSKISQQTYPQWDIAAILDEESAALFAGDKSPEETAAIIQNRAAVYLAE
jgi:ABC-type glycerol-3-phosphate transport system substrate-binding protein